MAIRNDCVVKTESFKPGGCYYYVESCKKDILYVKKITNGKICPRTYIIPKESATQVRVNRIEISREQFLRIYTNGFHGDISHSDTKSWGNLVDSYNNGEENIIRFQHKTGYLMCTYDEVKRLTRITNKKDLECGKTTISKREFFVKIINIQRIM